MSLDIGTLVGFLDLDAKAFDRKLDRADETARRSGRKSGKGFGDEFGKESERSMNDRMTSAAGRIMRAFGGILGVTAKPTAITVATAFSAQFLASVASGLASGAVKLAHGFAAGLALLPAMAVGAGLAIGTLKLALSGMGDALSAGLTGDTEAFNEALEGMSPSAREVAREVVGLKGHLDQLRSTVQEGFFGPLVAQVRPLAEQYLPAIESTMGGIARAFGAAARTTIEFFALPDTAARVDAGLRNVETAVGNVAGGLTGLVQAFLPLFTVGATFLPGLTAGFGGATNSLAGFMAEAERTGALRDFIQGGIDSIRSLIDTGAQVGRIFGNIGAVLSTAFAGIGGPAGGLLDALEGMTERAAEFVQTARGSTVVGQVFSVIRNLLSTLFGTFQRLAPVVGRVFGPILPQIAAFTAAVVELAGSIVEALEPALGVISDVIGAVLPVLTDVITLLADNEPVIQGIAIGIAAALVPAFVLWAISAANAAIATLALLAPFILIGVAVAALAALVIIHWDTIKGAIEAAFNWVRDNWPLLLAILTGPIGIAVLLITSHWDSIKAGATAAKDWIVGKFNAIKDFITGLPGAFAGAAVGLWSWLTNGISSAAAWVVDKINMMIRAFNRLPFVGNISEIGGGGNSRQGRPFIPRSHSGELIGGGAGDEVLRILQGGEEVLARSDPRNTANLGAAARPGSGALAGRIVIDVTGTDRGLVELIQHRVRADFGGDVQVALGQ